MSRFPSLLSLLALLLGLGLVACPAPRTGDDDDDATADDDDATADDDDATADDDDATADDDDATADDDDATADDDDATADDDDTTPPPPPEPTITAVDPAIGELSGGTAVSITGSGYLDNTPGVTTVMFGANPAVGCLIASDTTLQCTTPEGDEAAPVTVSVSNANGSDELVDGYTYELIPWLYAADGKTGLDGDFYRIDPADGSAEVVGPVGFSITGLCMRPDGAVFGTESTQSGNQGNARLISIDPETGAGTVIGELFDGTLYHSSTADCTFVGDRLIGWSEFGDDPIEIDPATGAVTVIPNTGVSSSGSGIAMHPDGTLYFVPGRVNGALYIINPDTGVGFEGPTLSGGTYDNINSMAFLGETLYAIDTQDMGSTSSQQVLVTIDVTTGVMTPLGPLPTPIDSLVGNIPFEAPPSR